MAENVPPSNEHHDHDPKRRIPRPDANALIQGLERLREHVEQGLIRLEATARERAAAPADATSELERKLRKSIAEYEETQQRFRAQVERREHEWRTALDQLEGRPQAAGRGVGAARTRADRGDIAGPGDVPRPFARGRAGPRLPCPSPGPRRPNPRMTPSRSRFSSNLKPCAMTSGAIPVGAAPM